MFSELIDKYDYKVGRKDASDFFDESRLYNVKHLSGCFEKLGFYSLDVDSAQFTYGRSEIFLAISIVHISN